MPDRTTKFTRGPLASRLATLGILALTTLIGLAFVTLVFGRVVGTEFSPTSFARREFFFFRMPFTRFQISPVTYTIQPNPYEDYLLKQKLLPPAQATIWNVADISYATADGAGEASILTNLLDAKKSSDAFVWLAWSQDHPNQSKVFWPLVSQAAQAGAYVVLPDLFEAAASISDDVEFARVIPRTLASLCAGLANDYFDAAHYDTAIRLYSLAIAHNSGSAELRIRRADCYARIGAENEAQADRSAAQKLPRQGSTGS
jgi:hypothetical protein